MPTVEVVLPVYNEERVLAASVRALHEHMSTRLPWSFGITIADNASGDETLPRALRLAAELPEVSVLHLAEKGRGRALKAAWSASDADVLAYMDIDLSTDLDGLAGLIKPLLADRADVAIGSRLAPGAQVTRGPKREAISRGYNILLRLALGAGFSDAQCGFKAIRRDAAAQLLPLVEDDRWFFDTELLFQAQRHRMVIHEVPVRWVDDPDSRVDILATVREDLSGIRRLRLAARPRRRPVASSPRTRRAPGPAG